MINIGQIMGRVGKIDNRTLPNGTIVTNMSMATSKKYTKNGEKVEKTTWHNITMYGKVAEIAQNYVAVGDLVYVKGEMDNQKFTDKNGMEREKSLLLAHEIKPIMKSSKEQKQPNEPTPEPNGNAFTDDDLPPW